MKLPHYISSQQWGFYIKILYEKLQTIWRNRHDLCHHDIYYVILGTVILSGTFHGFVWYDNVTQHSILYAGIFISIIIAIAWYIRHYIKPEFLLAYAMMFSLTLAHHIMHDSTHPSHIKSGYYIIEGTVSHIKGFSDNKAYWVKVHKSYGKTNLHGQLIRVKNLRHDHHHINIGCHVTFSATMFNAIQPISPYHYNVARHWAFDSIVANGKARGQVSSYNCSHQSWLHKARNALHDIFLTTLNADNAAIAIALITGDKYYLSHAQYTMFQQAGLAHVLAISGLHMAIIGGLVFWVMLRLLLCINAYYNWRFDHIKWAAIAAIILLSLYYIMATTSASLLRAYSMIILFFIALIMMRKILSLHNVIISMVIILVINPAFLFNPGFQLSYSAVIALIIFFTRYWPIITNYCNITSYRAKVIGAIIASSVIASSVTMPLAAWHFGFIYYNGFFSNLLAVPLLSVALMPLLLVYSIINSFGPIIPSFIIAWPIDLMRFIAQIFSGEGQHIIPISPVIYIAFYGALAVIACLYKYRIITLFLSLLLFIYSLSNASIPDIYISNNIAVIAKDGDVYKTTNPKNFAIKAVINRYHISTHKTDDCFNSLCYFTSGNRDIYYVASYDKVKNYCTNHFKNTIIITNNFYYKSCYATLIDKNIMNHYNYIIIDDGIVSYGHALPPHNKDNP